MQEVLADLNLLYKYGNVYFDSSTKMCFRDIQQIQKYKETQITRDPYLNKENTIKPYSDSIVPIFDLDETAKINVRYLKLYEEDLMKLMIKYPHMYIMPALQTDVEFASKVAEGQPWDYKREIGWNNYRVCIFNGKKIVLKGEDIGNIHYGYVGSSRNFSETTLCIAGGLVQVITSKGGALFQFTYDSYFDDPNDQKAIKRGVSWYKTGAFR